MSIKIRKLTVGDNRFLIKLIDKLIKEFREVWLKDLIKQGKETDSSNKSDEENKAINTQIFYSVINLLLSHFSNEVTEWFASLLNISIEEYEKLDFSTDAIIIEQIINDESFQFFFQKAFALYNLKQKFGNFTNIGKKN